MPGERPESVLEAYAFIAQESRGHRSSELAAFLHNDEHLARAEQRLHEVIRELVAAAAEAGAVRNDVTPLHFELRLRNAAIDPLPAIRPAVSLSRPSYAAAEP